MKRTLIIILAALMAISVSSAATLESVETNVQTDKKQKKQKAEVKEVTFDVHLHCKNCVAKVFDNLSRAKGVKDLDVSLEKQTVYIKYDSAKTSEQTLKETIEKLGYPVNAHEAHKEHGHHHE